MKKLFKNKKGFTLMEMLIVVAIIVILVAISMPIFSNQVDNARKATDSANERAAKAMAVAELLSGNKNAGHTYYYDAQEGILKDANSIKGYGQSKDNKDMIVWVTIDATGNISTKWWDAGIR